MSSKLDAFRAAARPMASASHSGNNPDAVRIAAECRDLVRTASERSPRSTQVHLGPSELGVECDRQIVHKLLQLPTTNHVSDPWPSIVGTGGHMWMEEAFSNADPARWFTERKVTPMDGHSGTADLYDAQTFGVLDHKFLGSTTHKQLQKDGPPRNYYVQLLLYALGYIRAGYRVDYVAILAWPRTGGKLAGLYVWQHKITAEDWQLVEQVVADTARRKALAAEVAAGRLSIDDVPRHPTDGGCYHCPAYRPEAAKDNGPGCPGIAGNRPEAFK